MATVTLADYLRKHEITQTEFAAILQDISGENTTQGLVSHWLTGRTRITAERAVAIERATRGKVQRYELRPDLFPRPKAA